MADAWDLYRVRHVPGLWRIPDYITPGEEVMLLSNLIERPWSRAIGRRVQQYGFIYDYSSRRVSGPTEPLPACLLHLPDRLPRFITSLYLNPSRFNQCIVNEYHPGQGIADHTDAPDFGPVILSLSLNSDVLMSFAHRAAGVRHEVVVPRRSLLVLSRDARNFWTHGIKRRLSDVVPGTGEVLPRAYRISVTYRSVATPPTATASGTVPALQPS